MLGGGVDGPYLGTFFIFGFLAQSDDNSLFGPIIQNVLQITHALHTDDTRRVHSVQR